MMAKRNLLLLIVTLVCVALCFAGTHDPWNGTLWDVASPDIDQPHGNTYKELYDLRKGVALRMNKEHETLATSSAGGVHKQGSARAFFQDAAPATQVDGSAFDSGDLGSLWFDSNASPDNQFNVLTATTPTWTPISTEVIAVLLASNRTFAGTLTVTGESTFNNHVNLGAGDDLIGSATSDITINTNKFTVAGATGNTLVAGTFTSTGVATLGDTSALATSGAPAADAQIANKKYVDDGAHKASDGSVTTGYRWCNVQGVNTKVFTKYLTGNLDADASTNVAHGLTAANILFVSVICYDDNESAYSIGGYRLSASADHAFLARYDATNVVINNVGTYLQGNAYSIKIEYTV